MPARITSPELWLFSFVMLCLSAALTSFYVKLFAFAPPAPDLVLLLPAFGLMIANMVLRFRQTFFGSLAAWSWAAIAVLALVSYNWSISPSDTFRDSLLMIIPVPYLCMIAAIADWRQIVVRMWGVGVALMFVTILLYIGSPTLGRMQDVYEGAMVGPWFEKNATGQFMAWMALLSLATLATRPRYMIPAAVTYVMALGLVVVTESATSLIATLLASAVFAWVALMRRGAVVSIPTTILTIVIAAPLAAVMIGAGDQVLGLLGRSGTLTGRVPIWDALRDYALNERGLLGHGHGAYWSDAYTFGRREFVFDQLGFEARHSHNALIEMRLGLGWVGAGLLIAATIQACLVALLRVRSSNGAYLAIPFAIAAILVGLVETSVIAPSNWGGAIFVLILAKMTLPPSEADRESTLKSALDSFEAPEHPMSHTPHTHGPAYA